MWTGSLQSCGPKVGTTSAPLARQPQVSLVSQPHSRRPLDSLPLQSGHSDVNDSIETYRFHEAANRIYDFFWGEFCDWYIELIKPRLAETADAETARAACANLVNLFDGALRLLHPVMPFITEEIWHAMYAGEPPLKSIALRRTRRQMTRRSTWRPKPTWPCSRT